MVYSQNSGNYTAVFKKFVGKVVYYGLFFNPLIHYPCTVWTGANCGLFSGHKNLYFLQLVHKLLNCVFSKLELPKTFRSLIWTHIKNYTPTIFQGSSPWPALRHFKECVGMVVNYGPLCSGAD